MRPTEPVAYLCFHLERGRPIGLTAGQTLVSHLHPSLRPRVAASCFGSLPSARRDNHRDDFGGVLKSYDAKYRAIAERGENVVIDGDCASACTIILGIVPRTNVCVTARARLGSICGSTRSRSSWPKSSW